MEHLEPLWSKWACSLHLCAPNVQSRWTRTRRWSVDSGLHIATLFPCFCPHVDLPLSACPSIGLFFSHSSPLDFVFSRSSSHFHSLGFHLSQAHFLVHCSAIATPRWWITLLDEIDCRDPLHFDSDSCGVILKGIDIHCPGGLKSYIKVHHGLFDKPVRLSFVRPTALRFTRDLRLLQLRSFHPHPSRLLDQSLQGIGASFSPQSPSQRCRPTRRTIVDQVQRDSDREAKAPRSDQHRSTSHLR